MVLVNIIYDENDYSLISIPDSLQNTIKTLAQEYLDWVPPQDDHYHWRTFDGRVVMCKNTNGFVEWLNSKYCKVGEEAQVIDNNASVLRGTINVEF